MYRVHFHVWVLLIVFIPCVKVVYDLFSKASIFPTTRQKATKFKARMLCMISRTPYWLARLKDGKYKGYDQELIQSNTHLIHSIQNEQKHQGQC